MHSEAMADAVKINRSIYRIHLHSNLPIGPDGLEALAVLQGLCSLSPAPPAFSCEALADAEAQKLGALVQGLGFKVAVRR